MREDYRHRIDALIGPAATDEDRDALAQWMDTQHGGWPMTVLPWISLGSTLLISAAVTVLAVRFYKR